MINLAILLGRVGHKEIKNMKSGADVILLSVATSKKYKDSSGDYKENTTWHKVSCFGKLAEIANKFISVGDLVHIQGEINNRKIESGERTGQIISSINASEIKLLPKATKTEPKEKDNTKSLYIEDQDVPF